MSAPPTPPSSTSTPAAREPGPTFSTFLAEIDEGRLAAQATEELEVLVGQLHRVSQIPNTKAKGSITITIAIASEAGGKLMSVTPEIKVKIPKPPKATSSFWRTKQNMLAANPPSQLGIPFEDVSSAKKGDVQIVR